MEQGDDGDNGDTENDYCSRGEMYFRAGIFVESGQSAAAGGDRYFVVCHDDLFQYLAYNTFGIFVEIIAVILK